MPIARSCRLIALPVLVAALTSAAVAQSTIPDWAQWRGPNKDGITTETTWASTGLDAPLWKKNVGLGYSGPCLQKGRLVTLGYDEASEQDIVVCLDPMTGVESWRYGYPSKKWDTMHEGGTLTTPVAEGDRVYVMSRLGTLYCFDLMTGAVRWQRVFTEDAAVETGAFGIPASPLILDEGLVLNVGKTMLVDKATGSTIWATKDYGYSYAVPVDAVIEGQPTIVVFNAAGLVTLDRATGAETRLFEWTSRYNVNCASPIVMGSKAFISTGFDDKGAAMLDLSDGGMKEVWTSKVMRSKMTGCVLRDGHLYGFDHAMLKCIDIDGNEKWRVRGLGTGAMLACADGRLIVISETGELVIGGATPEGFTEQVRRTVFTEGKCWTTPVVAGGLIYLRNNKGDLVCLDHRATGT